jgi:hypothetical protein
VLGLTNVPFAAQIDKDAKQYCNVRSGSRGAKALNSYVDQQREAERRAKLKRKEALLYRSPEDKCSTARQAKVARPAPVVAPLGERNR